MLFRSGEDWSDGATVYVKLIQGTTVLAVQTVSAGSGAYSFSGVATGSYTLVLDNNPPPPTPPPLRPRAGSLSTAQAAAGA